MNTTSSNLDVSTNSNTCSSLLPNNLNFFYTNADSLSNKFNELLSITNDTISAPDILCITETLPKNVIRNEYQNYNMRDYEGYHTNIGRGVSIYVKKHIISEQVYLNQTYNESVWLRLRPNNHTKIIVGCIYRSPNSSPENNGNLVKIIQEACKLNANHHLILGDFNYKEVNWSTNTVHTRPSHPAYILHEKINDLFLDQLIHSPTRYREGEQENTLDWVIADCPDLIEDLNIGPPLGERGDHCVITFTMQFMSTVQHFGNRLNFFKGDYNKIRDNLKDVNWERLMENKNCQDSWDIFVNTLTTLTKKFIPEKKAKNRRNQAWINKDIIDKIREKCKAWKTYIKNKCQANWRAFTEIRNSTNRAINKAKEDYELKIAQNINENPKIFWNYVRTHSSKNNMLPTLIDINGKEINLDIDKANSLNTYFASVFTKESLNTLPVLPDRSNGSSLNNIKIDKEEVEKTLNKLNVSKAAGPDNIHAKVLYELRSEINVPLNIIYNRSLIEGKLPVDWKQAYVKPLFKKGCKKTISNYRPVSLTSICCKTMERIVKKELMSYLENNQLISMHQHGFRPGRSCCTQLLEVINIWTKILDKGIPIDCVYLDYAKAFDKVPHKRLINKIRAYGINGNLLNWLENFLENRRQKVIVNNNMSDEKIVLSGIPQGSVLGPVLFIIYINDLPEEISSNIKIFADDTKIFKALEIQSDKDQLQNDLDKLIEWSNKWQLPFNVTKCKVMHYGNNNPNNQYIMNNISLEETPTEKDLGVTFDQNLKFSTHIKNIVSKANSRLGIIKRNFSKLTPETLLPLYKTLVRPLLEYCCNIWNPQLKCDFNEIERIQRRATRLILPIMHKSYKERLKILNLDSLAFRRRRSDMIQVYKIFHKFDNLNVEDFFEVNTQATRGHNYKIAKPRSLRNIRLNSFAIRTINDWNSLKYDTVNSLSINSFKSALHREWKDHPDRLAEFYN